MTAKSYKDDCTVCGKEITPSNIGYTCIISGEGEMVAKYACDNHSEDDVVGHTKEEVRLYVHGDRYQITPADLEGKISGDIEDIMVYDSALTEEEVGAIYESLNEE